MCHGRYSLPLVFGVSSQPNLQSQSNWCLFNGAWQQRPIQLDSRLTFEIQEMTLQMQQAVRIFSNPMHIYTYAYTYYVTTCISGVIL